MASDSMLLDGYPAARGAPLAIRHARQAGTGSGDSTALCRAVLDQLLRQTVISRLRLAHPEGAPAPRLPARRAEPAVVAARLAVLLRRGTQRDVDCVIESLLQDDEIDTLFLDIVPDADEAVQEREDAGDHAEATLAEWRLQELIERLSPRFQAAGSVGAHGRQVLLAEAETPNRRVRMLLTEECLTREGWVVWAEPRLGPVELNAMVDREWFAMVALDAAGAAADHLATMIRGLRRASCNPQMRVLVISAALARRPDRMARLGADAAAGDLRNACAQAKRLLTLMPARA